MGDRTYTTIRFSGQLPLDNVDEFVQALKDDALRCENELQPYSAYDDKPGNLSDTFHDYEANYGTLENAEAIARELHLSYLKSWDAGGDYGPGMTLYNAVVDTELDVSSLDGEPVIALSELVKHFDAGKIEEQIGFMRAFADFDKHYPPLEVVP